jgi:hypothetical protein|tara:strand:- start:1545 stop:2021 length:477 start_codon:yes stop_codon:yes gene_type:complete
MSNHSKVSSEELDALLPQTEVNPRQMSQVERKIRTRCILIASFWLLRIFLVTYFPEFILATRAETQLLTPDEVNGLLLIRISMVVLGATIYLLSFFTNQYFRTINVLALVIVSCLIWSDMEVYILSSIGELTLPSLGMIMFRFIPLTLLFLNYIDIRK